MVELGRKAGVQKLICQCVSCWVRGYFGNTYTHAVLTPLQ